MSDDVTHEGQYDAGDVDLETPEPDLPIGDTDPVSPEHRTIEEEPK